MFSEGTDLEGGLFGIQGMQSIFYQISLVRLSVACGNIIHTSISHVMGCTHAVNHHLVFMIS